MPQGQGRWCEKDCDFNEFYYCEALQTLDVLHRSCTLLPAAAVPGHVWACAVVSRALEEICVPELILTSPAERAHVGVGELDIFTGAQTILDAPQPLPTEVHSLLTHWFSFK